MHYSKPNAPCSKSNIIYYYNICKQLIIKQLKFGTSLASTLFEKSIEGVIKIVYYDVAQIKKRIMDRQLTKKERGGFPLKKWKGPIVVVIIFLIAGLGMRSVLSRKVKKSDFIIAQVERGDIEQTFSASGLVKPAFEREINAPVATEIKNVILQRGAQVNAGDLIMELDQEFTQLEYEKLRDELELRKNNIEKLKLQFDKDLRDLDYQDQIKALSIAELTAQVADKKRLLQIGGVTQEDVEQAALKLQVAQLEKKMLENDLQFKRSVNKNDKKNLELEYTIQQKRLRELKRKLSETNVKAPSSGVITWINKDIGRTVLAGETLVRIADLNQYEIQAESSDRNSEKIQLGLTANIRIGNKVLKGKISRILPSVENNTVRFFVKLKDESASILRPNLRVEVFVITEEKQNVIRIRNGAAFRGAANMEVFFVEGNKAVKKPIKKGLTNANYVEILTNAKPGDRIIISQTDDYNDFDDFILLEQ